MMDEVWLWTADEVANALAVTRGDIEAMYYRGELKGLTINGNIRWRPDDILAYLNKLTARKHKHPECVIDVQPRSMSAMPSADEGWLALVKAEDPNVDGRQTQTYFIVAEGDNRMVKIGRSHSPEQRLKDLGNGSPLPLRLLGTIRGDHEAKLHAAFKASRHHGEWFHITVEMIRWFNDSSEIDRRELMSCDWITQAE